jgi:thiol-disulfide isomerase/thioredoxin
MLERLLIAAGLLVLLVGVSWLVRAWWTRRRQRLVGELRRNGAAHGGPRILYFSTPYCVTCREMQEPALERLQRLAPVSVEIVHVDPVEQPEVAKQYRVLTVPTTAVFDCEGKLVEINYGYASFAQLAQQLGFELPEAATRRYDI